MSQVGLKRAADPRPFAFQHDHPGSHPQVACAAVDSPASSDPLGVDDDPARKFRIRVALNAFDLDHVIGHRIGDGDTGMRPDREKVFRVP